MATGIEWTDETWNPVAGCSVYSPGCKNCYAMQMAHRLAAMGQAKYQGLTQIVNGHAVWTGEVRPAPDDLEKPLHWRRPRRIFVNSMSDLFHETIPDEEIDRVFAVMLAADWHTYQVLTKRADRMHRYLNARPEDLLDRWALHLREEDRLRLDTDDGTLWPLPHVWLGVSVEDQRRANGRIPLLMHTPAAVRFLSCEPLLGPVDLDRWLWDRYRDEDGHRCDEPRRLLHWVIVGGESGPGARPMHPQWARSIRDQCIGAAAFNFKQWGAYVPFQRPEVPSKGCDYLWVSRLTGRTLPDCPQPRTPAVDAEWEWMGRVGKHRAGRLLDGRTWDEFPEVAR